MFHSRTIFLYIFYAFYYLVSRLYFLLVIFYFKTIKFPFNILALLSHRDSQLTMDHKDDFSRRKASDHFTGSSHRIDSPARFNSRQDKEPGERVGVIVPRRGAVDSLRRRVITEGQLVHPIVYEVGRDKRSTRIFALLRKGTRKAITLM